MKATFGSSEIERRSLGIDLQPAGDCGTVGTGGTVKRSVWRAVKSRRLVVFDALKFVEVKPCYFSTINVIQINLYECGQCK